MVKRRPRKNEDDWGLDDAQKACKPKACAIQRCLSRSAYQERACAFEIEAYHECVKRHRALLEENGEVQPGDAGGKAPGES